MVATYLAHPVPLDRCKRACLRYLLWLDETDKAERICEIALRFCTERITYGAAADSEETTNTLFLQIHRSLEEEQLSLLWQLRAVCRFLQDQRRQRDARVLQTAATAARGLTLAAQGVRSGLLWTAGALSAGLEATGDCAVRHSAPDAWWDDDPKGAVRAVTYSGAARRATAHTCLAAAATVQHLRDAATRQIRDWSAASNNSPHQYSWPRHPDQRVALQAAGHLALATLGAAALVGEGVVEGTSTVTQSATRAVAAVVEHRGGATAGRVIQDVGETVDNVWKTAAHVTLLSSSGRAVAVAKVVAKNTGKVHVEEQQELLLMRSRCSSNDSDDRHHRHPKEQTSGCEKVVGEVAIAKQDTVFY